MYDTYIPLLTYAHADGEEGAEVIPGLAKELPKITNGGKTYTLFLRKGLKYSNGEPVKASRLHVRGRTLLPDSTPAARPSTPTSSAPKSSQKTKKGGISGIKTNDKTGEIVIHLVRPRGTFTNELALMFVAPVPPNTPEEDQSANPPPATGPYMITQSEPGRGWAYERNPEWAKDNGKLMPEIPAGHVDKIEIEVLPQPVDPGQRHRSGQAQLDAEPPAARPLPGSQGTNTKAPSSGSSRRSSTYYFWMNTTKPPFNNLKVRQAVNYAVDPAALERIYAGQIAATQQILPPGMPGYKKFELYPHNMEKAKELIAEAGPTDQKSPSGPTARAANSDAGDLLPGRAEETRLQGGTEDPQRRQLLHGDRQPVDPGPGHRLGRLVRGLPAPERLLRHPAERRKHPADQQREFLADQQPGAERKDQRTGEEQLGPQQEEEYAELDKAFMEQAPWAPYGTRTLSTFVSNAINLETVIWNPTFETELTSLQFK